MGLLLEHQVNHQKIGLMTRILLKVATLSHNESMDHMSSDLSNLDVTDDNGS